MSDCRRTKKNRIELKNSYLMSGSLSKTKAVSLSEVKAKRTFGAVLFLLFRFILLSLRFIFMLIFGSGNPVRES